MNIMTTFYFLFYSFMLIIIIFNIGFYTGNFMHSGNEVQNTTSAMKPEDAYSAHRKLMLHGACTDKDISISQSIYPSSGIPQYIVQIVNTCISGCAPSNVHLHCGWFASTRTVNPRAFRRLSFDDCLINEGRPLKSSQIIRFTYSNSFMYPLQLKSSHFC